MCIAPGAMTNWPADPIMKSASQFAIRSSGCLAKFSTQRTTRQLTFDKEDETGAYVNSELGGDILLIISLPRQFPFSNCRENDRCHDQHVEERADHAAEH